MNSYLSRSPKVFKNSRNDLKNLQSPVKTTSTSVHRPIKVTTHPAPPPGEEWDVDDEEAMASPLFSVTPHSKKRFDENVALSPYAPALPRSPNEMSTNVKSARYLSSKDNSVALASQSLAQVLSTSRSKAAAMSPTPPRRQHPVQRYLRAHIRASMPTERKTFMPRHMKSTSKVTIWDLFTLPGILKHILSFCSISAVVTLLKVNHRLWKSREVNKRLRDILIVGLDANTRGKYWSHVTAKIRSADDASRYFHPAVHCPHEIRDDIVRTPSLINRQGLSAKHQHSLMRVLDAVAGYNRDIGYCQGMNYIAGLLVQMIDCEEECFWIMNTVLNDYNLKSLLKPGLSRLKLFCFQLDCFMEWYLPKVHRRMKELEISTEVYAAKWFITLFSYELSFPVLVKVWDLFFFKGWKVIFRLILALFSTALPDLLHTDSNNSAKVLRAIVKKGNNDDNLLKRAFTFKVTRRLLRDLEDMKTRKCRGKFQLLPGNNRKLQWVLVPFQHVEMHASPTAESSDESSLASRLISKVVLLFKRDGLRSPQHEEEDGTPENNLDSTICLDELPVPLQASAAMKDFDVHGDTSLLSNEELKEALSIKNLDSGKVYYRDVVEHCEMCGADTHSSQYCTEDGDMTPRVLPSIQLHGKDE